MLSLLGKKKGKKKKGFILRKAALDLFQEMTSHCLFWLSDGSSAVSRGCISAPLL